MELSVFENLKKRHTAHGGPKLSRMDAAVLRRIGLNPDDFRDALEGRQRSVLFTPFRHPRQD